MSSLTIHDHRLSRNQTILPDVFLDEYMPNADGTALKVYLYLIRQAHAQERTADFSGILSLLSITEEELDSALSFWEQAGLLSFTFRKERGKERIQNIELLRILPLSENKGAQQLFEKNKSAESSDPEEEPLKAAAPPKNPELSADRMKALESNSEARQILFITEQYLGKPLSRTDMRRILYLYDELHFSLDLIDYLIEYCVAKGKKSLNYIETVGLAWHRQGIRTPEAAKAAVNLAGSQHYQIFKFFGIRSHDPVPAEIQLMDKWLKDYGFSSEIIEEAARRTLEKTGNPSLPYADRILSDWAKEKVHRMDDILKLDEVHRQEVSVKESSAGKRSKAKREKGENRFNDFKQRAYDYEQLTGMRSTISRK